MAIVWLIDIIFAELAIAGLYPLFLTTLLVWTTSFFLGAYKLD